MYQTLHQSPLSRLVRSLTALGLLGLLVTARLTAYVWHLAQGGSNGHCLQATTCTMQCCVHFSVVLSTWICCPISCPLPIIMPSDLARHSSPAVSPHCTREIRCCRDTLLLSRFTRAALQGCPSEPKSDRCGFKNYHFRVVFGLKTLQIRGVSFFLQNTPFSEKNIFTLF